MAANEDINALLKSRKTYRNLTVICLFSLALLHGIHSFFFTFFFWLSLGFGIIAVYYHILIKRSQNPSSFRSAGSRDFNFQKAKYKSAQDINPINDAKRKVIIGAVVIFGSFFFFILLGIFFSDGSNDGDGYSVYYVDSQTYDEAWEQYNQKNYHKTVEILRPIMVRGNQDSQAMLLLGDGYYEIQNLDSAYVWYNKAYEAGQRNANLSHLIAYIMDTKGNTITSIPFYKEALSLDSSKVEIYERLAELEPESSHWYLTKAQHYKSQ